MSSMVVYFEISIMMMIYALPVEDVTWRRYTTIQVNVWCSSNADACSDVYNMSGVVLGPTARVMCRQYCVGLCYLLRDDKKKKKKNPEIENH